MNFFTNITFWSSVIVLLLSIILNQWVIPWLTKRKRLAKEKLSNFYNVAYAFVKIREDFSALIKGEMHNKENCGFFHSFNDEGDKNISQNQILNEAEFFNYATKNFVYLDKELRNLFVDYLRQRGPINIQRGMKCDNPKLISLRKKLEIKIIKEYLHYEKIVNE